MSASDKMKKIITSLVFLCGSMSAETPQHHDVFKKMAKKCLSEQFPTEQSFGKEFLGPFENMTVNETTWPQRMNSSCAYQSQSLKNQFRTDVNLWWNTIFKQPENVSGVKKIGGKILQDKHLVKLKKTQDFLKRMFIMFAYAPLSYVLNDNAAALPKSHPLHESIKPFPFPLASALSHGGRVLVVLRGINDKSFFNLLLGGNESIESISFLRSFASHGVHEEGGRIFEDKLFAGVLDTLALDHHGVNVPFGGVGNINELGYLIGPEGQSYNQSSTSRIGKYQLGHLFIGKDRFPKVGLSSLLVGMESTEPGGTSPFKSGGKSHGIISGMEDQTLNRSVTGGQKWLPLIGSMAPASYGGLIVYITPEKLDVLKNLWNKILLIPDDRLKTIFKPLLAMNSTEAQNYLNSVLK